MEQIQDNMYKIEASELLDIAMERRADGWRLVQICCSYVNEEYDIIYSFAKEYEFINYKVIAPKDQKVDSISRVYSAAIFYENEMSELFGCPITNMEVDLKNKFIRIKEETPFIDKKEAE